MTRTLIGIVSMAVIMAMAFSVNAEAPPEKKAKPQVNPAAVDETLSKGLALIKHAAEAQKYAFLFFYQTEDEQTQAMRPIFDATMQKVADKAEGIVINVAEPAEKAVVMKLKVDRAPMPLVLALAPNGAITGGYPLKFDEEILMGAFCGRSTWESLKALQDGKLVILCVQNQSTKFAPEATQAVRGVKAIAMYGPSTEVVMLDPGDKAEADAVKRLGIDPKLDEAVTILIAPPATIVYRFKGAVTKDAIVAEIQKAAAGKGGCCPGRSCGAKPPAGAQPAGTPGKPQPVVSAVKAQPGTTAAPQQPGATAVKPQPGAPTGQPQPVGAAAGKP